jgi:hypothetical protein
LTLALWSATTSLLPLNSRSRASEKSTSGTY